MASQSHIPEKKKTAEFMVWTMIRDDKRVLFGRRRDFSFFLIDADLKFSCGEKDAVAERLDFLWDGW